jgi:hypothetical protein
MARTARADATAAAPTRSALATGEGVPLEQVVVVFGRNVPHPGRGGQRAGHRQPGKAGHVDAREHPPPEPRVSPAPVGPGSSPDPRGGW